MGCVQAKVNSPNQTRGHLERMKNDNAYVVAKKKGEGSVSGKQVGKVSRSKAPESKDLSVAEIGGRGGAELEKQPNNGGSGRSNSMRTSKKKKKKIGGDEPVKGWPKWLVDNIPPDVLAGLVPKSADSYDKLAKVSI